MGSFFILLSNINPFTGGWFLILLEQANYFQKILQNRGYVHINQLIIYKKKQKNKAQSAGAVEYTDCISGYDIRQSDGEAPVVLEVWWMQSTPLLPSLPDPHWPRVVAPDRVLSMSQIELFDI